MREWIAASPEKGSSQRRKSRYSYKNKIFPKIEFALMGTFHKRVDCRVARKEAPRNDAKVDTHTKIKYFPKIKFALIGTFHERVDCRVARKRLLAKTQK